MSTTVSRRVARSTSRTQQRGVHLKTRECKNMNPEQTQKRLAHRKARRRRLTRKLARQQLNSENAQETRYWIQRTEREITNLRGGEMTVKVLGKSQSEVYPIRLSLNAQNH